MYRHTQSQQPPQLTFLGGFALCFLLLSRQIDLFYFTTLIQGMSPHSQLLYFRFLLFGVSVRKVSYLARACERCEIYRCSDNLLNGSCPLDAGVEFLLQLLNFCFQIFYSLL